MQTLSQRLVAAQEEERRRVARELHDEVGQAISVVLVELGRLESRVPAEQSESRALVSLIRKLAEGAVAQVRDMALLLRPSMLDDLGQGGAEQCRPARQGVFGAGGCAAGAGGIRVSIQDDGAGFDPSQERGMGILGMEERVKSLGGVFRIDSQRGGGTVVSLLLPVAKSTAGGASS